MVQLLPPKKEIETKAVLRKAALAHKALAELKGVVTIRPPGVLSGSHYIINKWRV